MIAKKRIILSFMLLLLFFSSCSTILGDYKSTPSSQRRLYYYLYQGKVDKAMQMLRANPYKDLTGTIATYESDYGYTYETVTLNHIHENFFKNAEFVKFYIQRGYSVKVLTEKIARYGVPQTFKLFYEANKYDISPQEMICLTVFYSNKELTDYIYKNYKIDIQLFSTYEVDKEFICRKKESSHYSTVYYFKVTLKNRRVFPQFNKELLAHILLSKENYYFLNYFLSKGLKIKSLDEKGLNPYYLLAFNAFHKDEAYKKTVAYFIKEFGAIQSDKNVINETLITTLNHFNYFLGLKLQKLYQFKLKASNRYKIAIVSRDIKYYQSLFKSGKRSKKILDYMLKDLINLDFLKQDQKISYKLLWSLALLNDIDLFNYFLKNFHINVNSLSRNHYSIITELKSVAIAKALIKAGLDLDIVSKNGHTALTFLMRYRPRTERQSEIAKLIVKSGADIFKVNLEKMVKNPEYIEKILKWKFYKNKLHDKDYQNNTLLSKAKLSAFFKTATIKQVKRFLYYAQKNYIPLNSKNYTFIVKRLLKNRPAKYKQLLLDYKNNSKRVY